MNGFFIVNFIQEGSQAKSCHEAMHLILQVLGVGYALKVVYQVHHLITIILMLFILKNRHYTVYQERKMGLFVQGVLRVCMIGFFGSFALALYRMSNEDEFLRKLVQPNLSYNLFFFGAFMLIMLA